MLTVIRKHVLSDLQPYVCTFSSCSLDSFQSQHSWFEHELLVHRSRWFCSQCIMSFESSDRLARHISVHHHEVTSDRQLSAIINQSKRPVESILPDECPFCVRLSEKVNSGSTLSEEPLAIDLDQFRRHLGRHLEEVALFALPRVNHDDGGSLDSNDVCGHPDQDRMSKGFRWVRDDCGRGWSIISRRRTTFIAIACFLALSRAQEKSVDQEKPVDQEMPVDQEKPVGQKKPVDLESKSTDPWNEPRSIFDSIASLIDISSKVLSLTVEYSNQVKSAKEDVDRFRHELDAFIQFLKSLFEKIRNTEARKLGRFNSLAEFIKECQLELGHCQKRLERHQRVGASTRVFQSQKLHSVFERFREAVNIALIADQT